MENYYQILGVSENASEDEIKRAFRTLAKKHHPDMGGDQDHFKKMVEAYRILSDKKLRAEYDTRRKFGGSGMGGGFDASDLGAFFRDQPFDDLLGSLFQDFFHAKTQRNLDVLLDIEVEIGEVVKGSKKNLQYERKVICTHCNGTRSETKQLTSCATCKGTGRVGARNNFLGGIVFESQSMCRNCRGTGKAPEKICRECAGRGILAKKEAITIDLPSGFDPGELIGISGYGDEDPDTKQKGQLILRVHVKPHPKVKIKGKNLFTEMELSIIDILRGGDFELKFLDDQIKILIPSNVRIDELIRIPKKGVGGGDLYIQIRLKPIKKLSRKAQQLLDELQKETE